MRKCVLCVLHICLFSVQVMLPASRKYNNNCNNLIQIRVKARAHEKEGQDARKWPGRGEDLIQKTCINTFRSLLSIFVHATPPPPLSPRSNRFLCQNCCMRRPIFITAFYEWIIFSVQISYEQFSDQMWWFFLFLLFTIRPCENLWADCYSALSGHNTTGWLTVGIHLENVWKTTQNRSRKTAVFCP